MSALEDKCRRYVDLSEVISNAQLERAELADDIAASMESKTVEIPTLGVFERHAKSTRKSWDHEGVFHELQVSAGQGSISRRERVDAETGEISTEGDLEFAFRVAQEAANPSWRVTYLRSVGIDPDEHSSVTYAGGYTIEFKGKTGGEG